MTGIVHGEIEKEDWSKVREQHWRKNGDARNDAYVGQSIVVKVQTEVGWYLVMMSWI